MLANEKDIKTALEILNYCVFLIYDRFSKTVHLPYADNITIVSADCAQSVFSTEYSTRVGYDEFKVL